MKPKNRDNVPGVTFDKPWKYLLLPGVIFQWWVYMNPGKGFRGVAASTRSARSPLMTYVFAVAVWIGLLIFLFHVIIGH